MKIAYRETNFRDDSLSIIAQANAICADYQAQGYDLTLRQLYYQFVARDLIPNAQKEYKRLGSIVNDARLAGLMDWDYIVDRTRNLRSLAHWDSPSDIVEAVARQYREDKWSGQPYRVEVWIEKDALVGVLERICNELDVPYFSCRGYTSQSEVWAAAQRLLAYRQVDQDIVILHLGDHDPSGIDMTRDITDRLAMFMDQVEQYRPPPNPAKITDSRAAGYIAEYGGQSWELDALEPTVLSGLIRDAVNSYLRHDDWSAAAAAEAEQRATLAAVSRRWTEVKDYVS
jgi:hypothetical protein